MLQALAPLSNAQQPAATPRRRPRQAARPSPGQLSMFAPSAEADSSDIADLVDQAVGTLVDLLRTELLAVAWSSGKDSSVCLVLALLAYQRARAAGIDPAPLVVLHGDTLVESPPVRALADEMLASLIAWCEAEGVPLVPVVYRPPLNQSYAVKVLSGTALPTFPEARRRICSAAWKVEPSGRALDRQALATVLQMEAAHPGRWPQIANAVRRSGSGRASWARQPVVVLGSRQDESARRAGSMAKHGQRPDAVTDEAGGRRSISPIASWSEADVWEVIGLAGTGGEVYPVWQPDFAELVRLYRGAAGGCVIVPGKGASSKACGARFGCHACQAIREDESAKALVDEPRWSYAAPLLRIRDFIAAIRHDTSRRSWLDCGEDPAGFIKVFPGPLAGSTIRDIVRYYMTADRLEAERAERFRLAVKRGITPNDPYVHACHAEGREVEPAYMARMQRLQFQVFNPQNAIACDIYASLRGHQARSFGILEAWHEVWHEGKSFFPPAVEPVKPQPLPEPRWVPVPFDMQRGWGHDILAAAMSETCPWDPQSDADGWPMMPQSIEAEFDVDEEAAWFIVEQEYPSHLRGQHMDPLRGPFTNLMYYLNVGCLIFSPAGRSRLTARIKRMERWAAMGLIEVSREAILAKSISHAEYLRRGGTMGHDRPFSEESQRQGLLGLA